MRVVGLGPVSWLHQRVGVGRRRLDGHALQDVGSPRAVAHDQQVLVQVGDEHGALELHLNPGSKLAMLHFAEFLLLNLGAQARSENGSTSGCQDESRIHAPGTKANLKNHKAVRACVFLRK